MLLTVVVAIVVLGVLIFVHELGHFIAAKAVGVGVPRFSIGFGPPTPIRFRRGETEYVVAWFPLGGYVKMASREEQEAMATVEGGETPQEFPPDKLFENKGLGARIVVIIAGVTMNAVFAWLLYVGIAAFHGGAEDPTTTIAFVDESALPEAAASLADLPFGTQIVRVNGDSVRSLQQIQLGITDPTSERLRLDFAGDRDPVIIEIPGTEVRARTAIALALKPTWEARIGRVVAGMPAAAAGLLSGDLIVEINGDTVRAWAGLTRAIEPAAGDTVTFSVSRSGELRRLPVIPTTQTVQNVLTGESREVGRIGVYPQLGPPLRVRYTVGGAVVEGSRRVWQDVELVLFTLKGMVTGRISMRELGGPILIGQVSGQFARAGVLPLLLFTAFLSVNLAILNLLPIPVLDGGQLVFLIVEGVRGKPLSLALRLRLTQAGVVVLLGLFAFVIVNDLVRVFSG